MIYRVETARTRVKRQLKRIPKANLSRVGKAVSSLASNPFPVGCVQLMPNVYRIRVGNYRVIYKVYEDEQLVLIGRIVRRSESTYRDIGSLFE